MYINYPAIALGLILIPIGMLLHELIHYMALRILGYNGKLVTDKKHLGLGIKPSGLRDNIVDAGNAAYFLLAPLPFTVIWFMVCFRLIGYNMLDMFNILVGLLCGLMTCGADLKQSLWVWRWWLKSRGFRKI